MEASGLGGSMMELVLIPGLLAAGVGSLVFIGLDAWTGLGTFSLAIPGLPHVGSPTAAEFGWALAVGVMAVPVGNAIRWLGCSCGLMSSGGSCCSPRWSAWASRGWPSRSRPRPGRARRRCCSPGSPSWARLSQHSASYTVGALLLLIACKGLAYGISLSSFRGGPTFPALFIGAAGGMALSHLPGLPLVNGVAIGIGAMSVVMLRLPLTSVLLASLLLASDGLAVMPLVIVAVVVAYVLSARLTPKPAAAGEPKPGPASEPAPPAPEAPTQAGRPA